MGSGGDYALLSLRSALRINSISDFKSSVLDLYNTLLALSFYDRFVHSASRALRLLEWIPAA